MILWSVKMIDCRNAKLAAFSVANENYGRVHLFWGAPGLGLPRPPIKPGTSNYFTALAEGVAGA
jgi:hypothetical protein